MNKVKDFFKNEKVLLTLTVLVVAFQPILDLDYLVYDSLHSIGLPRPSTIVKFVIIPILLIYAFLLKDNHKKKTLVFGGVYAVTLGLYFVLHCKQCITLYETLDLTKNFYFNTFQELTYVATIVLPFGLIYVIYNLNFTESLIKKISIFISTIISWPIFFGDLFLFGKSTYIGYTKANFLTWFTGIYDTYLPREIASKFFFSEGNTIGILLFMVLILLYYFLTKETNKKLRIYLVVLIVIQSLSMQILATRVATYGAVLIPIVYIVIYLFNCLLLKNDEFNKKIVIHAAIMAAVFGLMLNWTPAVVNQRLDSDNDVALLSNDYANKTGRDALKYGKNLIPGTEEYINFYTFMFEEYGIRAKYITSISKEYYTKFYNYKHDPKFWVDVTFMPVYDRVSGRQMEKIFMDYKYSKLTFKNKFLGMGYSTFMNGSILLEKDFTQQIYTLGYVGELLCVLPWIFVTIYGAFNIIKNWKKLLKLDIMVYAIALLLGFGCGYVSGHTIDQFITTTFMAMLVAVLLYRISKYKNIGKIDS